MKSSKATNDVTKPSRIARATALDESPPRFSSRSPARATKQLSGAKITRTRSPARRSPSRRSPSRKSPTAKSPSRKSPARKSPARKSPARKSPSRTAKEAEEVTKSPSRRPAIKSESSKVVTEASASSSVKLESSFTSRITRPRQISRESIAIITSNDLVNTALEGIRERRSKPPEDASASAGSRRSTRLRNATDNFEKIRNLAQNTRLPKSDYSFENFSDSENLSDDDPIPRKERSITRTLATPIRELSVPRSVRLEFGGWVGVLFQIIFMPAFILGVNIACSNSQCNFTSWPNLQPFKKLDNWINLKSLLIYILFVSTQVLLSLIPYFGKRIALPHGKHTFNGLFCLIATLFMFLGLEYFDIPVFDMVYSQYIPLLVTSVSCGLLMAVALFIRSRKVPLEERNSFGNTGILLYDFWMGREVNPCLFGKFHVKLVIFRTALIGAVLMNIVNLYRGSSVKNFPILSTETSWEIETYVQIIKSISINPTLLVFALMQIFYFAHAIAGEATIVSTFEYQYEGTGLMLALGYSLYPFTTMSITRYILEQNVVLPNIALLIVSAIYLTGFYIYNASNAQKSAFRENPLDPKFFLLETLPTFQGKRLLISGWWGWVRHPNYLGDILIHLSWGAGALWAPPLLFIIATILLLAHRAARDGQRCRIRYGAAWERYCRRVPYNLVPNVY